MPTLDGPVLVALANVSGPVTGRQVHKLARTGSEAGVRLVLTRLVEQGVVLASPAGSAWLYAINRDHVAWPAIAALAAIRGEFLSRLRARFGEWEVRARSAALFGSAAREDGTTDSDIDVLLVRQSRTDPDDPTWLNQIATLKDDVAAWTGNHCQVYEVDADDLRRHIMAGQAIVADWRRDAITVAGADVRNLLRELGSVPVRPRALKAHTDIGSPNVPSTSTKRTPRRGGGR